MTIKSVFWGSLWQISKFLYENINKAAIFFCRKRVDSEFDLEDYLKEELKPFDLE